MKNNKFLELNMIEQKKLNPLKGRTKKMNKKLLLTKVDKQCLELTKEKQQFF